MNGGSSIGRVFSDVQVRATQTYLKCIHLQDLVHDHPKNVEYCREEKFGF